MCRSFAVVSRCLAAVRTCSWAHWESDPGFACGVWQAVCVLSLKKWIASVALLYCPAMGESPLLPSQIETGDLQAAEQFLPLVYGELRRLAAAMLSHERPGQTLEPT